MRRALITLLCALLAGLTACSSTPKPQAAPPTERQSLDRSARLAFAQGQYAQAATLYEAALEQALAEDAPAAIIDTRFNLALCKTYLGQYDAALTQVAQAEAERSRRSLPDDPELQLLAGTIHYRAGESGRAKEILDGLLQHSDVTGATRSKAHFVAGLVAADDSVPGPLRAHIAAMPIDPGSTAQADRLELEGRLAGIEGDTDRALQLLDQVGHCVARHATTAEWCAHSPAPVRSQNGTAACRQPATTCYGPAGAPPSVANPRPATGLPVHSRWGHRHATIRWPARLQPF